MRVLSFFSIYAVIFASASAHAVKINMRSEVYGTISQIEANLPKVLADGVFRQDFMKSNQAAFVGADEFLTSFGKFLDDCGVDARKTAFPRGSGLNGPKYGLIFQKRPNEKENFEKSKGQGIIEIKEYIEVNSFARLVKEENGDEYWSVKNKDEYGNTFQVEAYVNPQKVPVWFRLVNKNMVAKNPLRAVLLMGTKWKKTCKVEGL